MFKFLIPGQWEDFEDLCWKLWRELWSDPSARKHGRRGQKQFGVDVFGQPKNGGGWAGVQCKKCDSLTSSEIDDEVEKAKEFKPPLNVLIVAATCPRDQQLQRYVRELTEKHRLTGLFEVEIWSWEDITDVLRDHLRVYDAFLSDLGLARSEAKATADVLAAVQTTLEKVIPGLQTVTIASVIDGTSSSSSAPGPTNVAFEAELASARALMKLRQFRQAVKALEALREKVWGGLEAKLRHRLLANIGLCKIELHDHAEGAQLLIDALQYDSGNSTAQCNAAAGYLLKGNNEEALRIVTQVLQGNPKLAQANSIKIETVPDASPFEDVLALVPPEVTTTREVAIALGNAARKRDLFPEAMRWFQVALDASQNDPEIAASLAECSYLSLGKSDAGFHIGRRTPGSQSTLTQALNLIDKAWESVRYTDLRDARAGWLSFRSFLKRILGDLTGSLRDIEEALTISPSNGLFRKNRALTLLDLNRFDEATSVLRGLLGNAEVPDAPILLGDILRRLGQVDEALNTLELTTDARSKAIAEELRFEIAIEAKRFESARESLNRLNSITSDEVARLVREARLDAASGREQGAVHTLERAALLVNDATPLESLDSLGRELYRRQQFALAEPVYTRLARVPGNDPITMRLLQCLYSVGLRDRALGLCQALETQCGYLPFASEIHSVIYDELGDLPNAERVVAGFLASSAPDGHMSLRLAWIRHRLGKTQEVEAYLKDPVGRESLAPKDVLQLASLLATNEYFLRAVELVHGALAKYPMNADLQLQYMGLVLHAGGQLDDAVKVSVVADQCAVQIQHQSGRTEWVVITSVTETVHTETAVPPTHPLAVRLMGHKAGERIVLREDDLIDEAVTIVEVKHILIHTLHQLMEAFPTRFPDDKRLYRFNVGDPEKLKEIPDPIKKVLDLQEKHGAKIAAAVELYRERKLPLSSLAQLLDKDPIELYDSITRDEETGFWCASGDLNEVKQALGVLQRPGLTCILDLWALLTLSKVGHLETLTPNIAHLGVGQSTVDLVRKGIVKLELFKDRGRESMLKSGDKIYRLIETSADIRARQADLETLVKWIRDHCSVLPVTAALALTRGERSDKEKLLGPAFHDAVLLASEPGRVLWSDDWAMRSLAKAQYGIDGVWYQAVAQATWASRGISGDAYRKVCVRLMELRHHYVHFDVETLLQAARDSQWSVTSAFRSVCETLSGGRTDDLSALGLAYQALVRILEAPALPFQVTTMAQTLMGAVTKGRDSDVIYRAFARLAKKHFALDPLRQGEIISLLKLFAKHIPGVS